MPRIEGQLVWCYKASASVILEPRPTCISSTYFSILYLQLPCKTLESHKEYTYSNRLKVPGDAHRGDIFDTDPLAA